jgi:hypothetical protein
MTPESDCLPSQFQLRGVSGGIHGINGRDSALMPFEQAAAPIDKVRRALALDCPNCREPLRRTRSKDEGQRPALSQNTVRLTGGH